MYGGGGGIKNKIEKGKKLKRCPWIRASSSYPDRELDSPSLGGFKSRLGRTLAGVIYLGLALVGAGCWTR